MKEKQANGVGEQLDECRRGKDVLWPDLLRSFSGWRAPIFGQPVPFFSLRIYTIECLSSVVEFNTAYAAFFSYFSTKIIALDLVTGILQSALLFLKADADIWWLARVFCASVSNSPTIRNYTISRVSRCSVKLESCCYRELWPVNRINKFAAIGRKEPSSRLRQSVFTILSIILFI